MIIQLALLMLLMIVSGLGPGMLVTKPMRLAPLERLCTAVGISWIIIYLAATAIYLAGVSWHWCYAMSLVFLIAFGSTLPDLRRMLAHHALRRTVLAGAVLTVWLLLLLTLIRNYSGGMWSGDWVEHYDRTEFFLHHYPYDHLFIGLYLLPARPPMMNLVAAFFLTQVGRGFAAFELCFALLNLSAFFPAALLLNRMARRGGRSLWVLVAALMSSPFFAENTTYTWTKLFCAFYVILAIALYLHKRNILAFVMLAAGCLVHYSAVVFTIFIVANYLWNMPRNRVNWREILTIVIICAALLATWFTWSIQRFGLHGTLATNTTVTDYSRFSAFQNIIKIVRNTSDSLIPPLTRLDPRWGEQSPLGFVRDVAFICYQQNILFMIGTVGAAVAIWILWPGISRRGGRRLFWLGMLAFCVPVSIATVGQYEPLGLAHAVLQPMALIGITAVAAYARLLPRWAWRLLVLGWALDFVVGILLQVYLENMPFERGIGSDGKIFWSMPIKLVFTAAQNFNCKQIFQVSFIGDYFSNATPLLLSGLIIIEILVLGLLRQSLRRAAYVSGSRRAVARKLS